MSVFVRAAPTIRLQDVHHRHVPCFPPVDFVVCGQLLTRDRSALSGNGTQFSDNGLLATVCGVKVQYNRFYTTVPYKSNYTPKLADVVLGRVHYVRNSCWKLDVNHRLLANLHLQNMNLPGGEIRRKFLEDDVAMKEQVSLGDLLSAEVRHISAKEQLKLHLRSLQLGKLGQGILVKVWPSLIKSEIKSLHELFGVEVLVAKNGFVWISPGLTSEYDGNYAEAVPVKKREIVVRIAACVRLLAKAHLPVYSSSLSKAYLASLSFSVKDFANQDITQVFLMRIGQLILEEAKKTN